MAAELIVCGFLPNALTQLAARWQIVRTLTAFARRIPESVPQGAIATRGAERCHDGHRMVGDEATASWERWDFCS